MSSLVSTLFPSGADTFAGELFVLINTGLAEASVKIRFESFIIESNSPCDLDEPAGGVLGESPDRTGGGLCMLFFILDHAQL